MAPLLTYGCSLFSLFTFQGHGKGTHRYFSMTRTAQECMAKCARRPAQLTGLGELFCPTKADRVRGRVSSETENNDLKDYTNLPLYQKISLAGHGIYLELNLALFLYLCSYCFFLHRAILYMCVCVYVRIYSMYNIICIWLSGIMAMENGDYTHLSGYLYIPRQVSKRERKMHHSRTRILLPYCP